jgi:hypothetical protein
MSSKGEMARAKYKLVVKSQILIRVREPHLFKGVKWFGEIAHPH